MVYMKKHNMSELFPEIHTASEGQKKKRVEIDM